MCNDAALQSDALTTGIALLIMAGFDIKREPYLRGVLNCMRLHILQDLRDRTRIYVPEACLLMGVVDELDVLEEGQVFLQIDRSPLLDSPQVIQGTVVVAKNPCFHPGDIRVLQAVDEPRLSHLRNVVVFPQRGYRPIPDEISGSDLDGDLYFVSWREDLIPPSGRSHPAMEFPSAEAADLGRAVEMADVANFFVDHAVSDNLGIIANSHLAMTDASSEGVRDARCLKLAEKHSEAVDFPKTGRVVQIEDTLRVKEYPDFMQNKNWSAYQSKTIIGRLFRALKDPYKWTEESSDTNTGGIYEADMDLLLEGHEVFVDAALGHRDEYEQQLLQIMWQHEVQDEFELVTGCILQWDKLHKKRIGKQYDKKARIVEAVQGLCQKFHRIFLDEVQQDSSGNTTSGEEARCHLMASAWYAVVYDSRHHGQEWDPQGQLYSFPWVLKSQLAEIKRIAVNTRSSVE